MTASSPWYHYLRIGRHFISTRAVEVLALQGSPMVGAVLGGATLGRADLVLFSLLLLGSVALTAHVFVLNDWAGYLEDVQDPRRASQSCHARGISRYQVALVAAVLLLIAALALGGVSLSTLMLGGAIAVLGWIYSCSGSMGKETPFAASLNHLVGGLLHFLLGYTVFHTWDGRGLVLGLFFGLVFAAGHLNQEVRDYEGDRLNSIRTCAVVFGCRCAFLASLGLFTIAYAVIVGLALFGLLPKLMALSIFVWVLHVVWSIRALRCGLGYETALWMQRRYRLVFALIGLALLLR